MNDTEPTTPTEPDNNEDATEPCDCCITFSVATSESTPSMSELFRQGIFTEPSEAGKWLTEQGLTTKISDDEPCFEVACPPWQDSGPPEWTKFNEWVADLIRRHGASGTGILTYFDPMRRTPIERGPAIHIADVVQDVCEAYPASAERTAGLRKLLEAADAFARCAADYGQGLTDANRDALRHRNMSPAECEKDQPWEQLHADLSRQTKRLADHIMEHHRDEIGANGPDEGAVQIAIRLLTPDPLPAPAHEPAPFGTEEDPTA